MLLHAPSTPHPRMQLPPSVPSSWQSEQFLQLRMSRAMSLPGRRPAPHPCMQLRPSLSLLGHAF
eukprot:608187-Alexandrium_andersonii.AAC.1